MPREVRFWKISPGRGGRDWDDWLEGRFCALYHWDTQPYFDETYMDLKKNYSGPDEFLDKTGFTGGPPHDWRLQLKAFVWEVNEGDIVFAYKKGTFIGWGKIGNYIYDEKDGHKRAVIWKEIKPPLNLEKTDVIKILRIPAAGTIKNIDDHKDEILKLLQKRKLNINDLGINPSKDKELISLMFQKLQVIFYGPPGTGKTYSAREFAVEFIEKDGV